MVMAHKVHLILYNYRLLMRSTHDYEDRVRYWLTDAEGGGQGSGDRFLVHTGSVHGTPEVSTVDLLFY